jgi:putative Ca2+/H+ antiporter (TMEM165/GDT1 family)
MVALLASCLVVVLAEMGDKTQLARRRAVLPVRARLDRRGAGVV